MAVSIVLGEPYHGSMLKKIAGKRIEKDDRGWIFMNWWKERKTKLDIQEVQSRLEQMWLPNVTSKTL